MLVAAVAIHIRRLDGDALVINVGVDSCSCLLGDQDVVAFLDFNVFCIALLFHNILSIALLYLAEEFVARITSANSSKRMFIGTCV